MRQRPSSQSSGYASTHAPTDAATITRARHVCPHRVSTGWKEPATGDSSSAASITGSVRTHPGSDSLPRSPATPYPGRGCRATAVGTVDPSDR
jgi:hypothetical protein